MDINSNNRLLRLPEVKDKTGLSRSSIYAFAKSGNFPKAISLGPRAVAWIESEITAWVNEKINRSRPMNQ